MDAFGVSGSDMAEADVFADDGGVLGFDQAVVSGVAGAAFGLGLSGGQISSFLSRSATTRLMNSEPLSEWNPLISKGN